MAKIVYNACYGGFGISMEAAELYEKLGGAMPIRRWSAGNKIYASLDSNVPRTDPVLVQVVETLGERANTRFSNLQIEDLPSGTVYRISEYDGYESVMRFDDHDWKIA